LILAFIIIIFWEIFRQCQFKTAQILLPPPSQEGDSDIERMGVLIGTFEKKLGLYFPLPFSESENP